jgi:ADP-heptose:LPS heptosyltransferase
MPRSTGWSEGYVDLVRLLPEVGRVIPFALRRWRKRFWQGETWAEVGALRDAIQARPYDAVLETQGCSRPPSWLAPPRAPPARR